MTEIEGERNGVFAQEMPAKWKRESTYIRKISDGQFEYGYLWRSTNFRKRPDVYSAEGVKLTVADAETARAELEI